MATPMVSGAAALLLQQNPNLTPDQVKARLMKTTTKNFPVSSVATDPTTGMSYTSYYDIFHGWSRVPECLGGAEQLTPRHTGRLCRPWPLTTKAQAR